MRIWKSAAVVLLGAFTFVARAADTNLFPFVLPWDDATPSITDLSGWLEKPAGKAGNIRVGDDAHFYAGDKRIKFIGVNLSFAAGMPAKEDGHKIAARLAKFGINVVRFHHMDSGNWPNGIRTKNAKVATDLDPEALDRLDYFIAQLKQHGIYANINLLVGRKFSAADGLPAEIASMEWKDAHVVGFWNAKHLESQKAYARALLDRVNPYTKTSYTSESSLAFVEINNEAGLVHAWLSGHVDKFPDVFLRELGEQWNAWLKRRHGTTEKLRQMWSAGEQPLGKELLKNGDFAQQLKGWNIEQHNGAKATANLVGRDALIAPGGGSLRTASPANALELRVNKPGTETWHVQFGQPGLKFEAGKAYTVSFRAKADSARAISVTAAQAHDPWKQLGLAADARLSNDWREFRFVFNAPQDETNARVTFGRFGGEGATISLANVSVKPGGVEGLRSAEEVGSIPLFAKQSFGQRTAEAQRDFIRFLTDTEERYWVAMYRFLKDELKVKALVGGTIGGCSPLNVQAKMDWMDTHAYWQHPHFPRKSWDMNDWIVNNMSMVNERGGTLPGLALKRIHGKPHAVTEYNHSAPNTFSSEGFLLLAAYGALQDWDAIYAYSYAHTRSDTSAWDSRRINSFFDIDQHPTKMATLVSAAAMFLRGDVKPAMDEVSAFLPRETEVDLLRTASAWSLVDGSKQIPKEAALMMKTSVKLSAPTGTPTWTTLGPRFIADNHQMVWDLTDPKRGVVTIFSESSRGVIGYGGGKKFALRDITIEPGETVQDGWSAITVNSFGKSFLVTATGLAENTGMGWKNAEKNTVGRDWGTAPSLVEGVPAKITFGNVPFRAKVAAYALDVRGVRLEPVSVERPGNSVVLNIGPKWKTLWYEVEVQ
jgi:hypothetical protein